MKQKEIDNRMNKLPLSVREEIERRAFIIEIKYRRWYKTLSKSDKEKVPPINKFMKEFYTEQINQYYQEKREEKENANLSEQWIPKRRRHH